MNLIDFISRFSGGFVNDEQLVRIYHNTIFQSDGCWKSLYTAGSRKPPCVGLKRRITTLPRIMLFLENKLSYEEFIEKNINRKTFHTCNNHRCINPNHLIFGKNIHSLKISSITDQETVDKIRYELNQGSSMKQLAKKYNLHYNYIAKIKNYKVWNTKNIIDINYMNRHTKLTKDDVDAIKKIHATKDITIAEISRVFGVSYNTIIRAIHGKTHKPEKKKRTKLSETDIILIKVLLQKKYTYSQIAAQFNVIENTVSRIATGKYYNGIKVPKELLLV